MTTNKAELVLGGHYLLTMDAGRRIIEGGAVAISGDTIVEVGTIDELNARHPLARHLFEPQGLIMPGLVNVHTHAAMSLFRGMADDLPLMSWLQEHIFPVEGKLNADLVYQGTLLSICEMIRSGTTSFCDMYLFAEEVGRAAEIAGIRAWVGEAVYDFPSPAYGEPGNAQACVQHLLDRYRQHPLVTATVSPHSVYTCSPALLRHMGDIAQAAGARYIIHLSENADEVQNCQQRYGCSPVAHLASLDLLNEGLLACHCVMLDADEIALLAKQKVKIAHCPQSNLKLGSGIAPAVQMLRAGIDLGLGTDGSASNNSVDLFREMDCAAKIHKVATMDPTVMDAWTTLYAATMGGARALGAERLIGSLEPGKKADCIVLDLNQPHLTPLYHPASHLVYAARGSDVIHSIINGQIVMQNRQFLALDEEEILRRAREIGGTLRQTRNDN